MADFQMGKGPPVKFPVQLQNLIDMGFEASASIEALDSTSGDIEAAVVLLVGGTITQVSTAVKSGSAGKASRKMIPTPTAKQQEIKDLHTKFMTSFKTQKCKTQGNHDKRMCFFFHSKADRRRNPFEIPYTCVECPNSSETVNCPDGDVCSKAHTLLERMFHPELFKISMCQRGPNKGGCERGNFCAFAHSDEDHRTPLSQSLRAASQAAQAAAAASSAAAALAVTTVGSNGESIHPGKLLSDSKVLDQVQERLVRLIKSQGAEGIMSSELPKRYFDVYSERLELTDEAGEKFRIKDLLLQHSNISVVMHKGVQPKYVYGATKPYAFAPPSVAGTTAVQNTPSAVDLALSSMDSQSHSFDGQNTAAGIAAPPSAITARRRGPSGNPLTSVSIDSTTDKQSGISVPTMTSPWGHASTNAVKEAAVSASTQGYASSPTPALSATTTTATTASGGTGASVSNGLGQVHHSPPSMTASNDRTVPDMAIGFDGAPGFPPSMGFGSSMFSGGLGSSGSEYDLNQQSGFASSRGIIGGGGLGFGLASTGYGGVDTSLQGMSLGSSLGAIGAVGSRRRGPAPESMEGLGLPSSVGSLQPANNGLPPLSSLSLLMQQNPPPLLNSGPSPTNSSLLSGGLISPAPFSGGNMGGASYMVEYSERLNQSQAECAQLRNQIASLRMALDERSSEFSRQQELLNASRERIESMEQRFSSASAETDSQKSQTSALRSELASFSDKLQAKEGEVNALKAALREKESALAKAESTKSSLVPELNKLRHRVQTMDAELAESKLEEKKWDRVKHAMTLETENLRSELASLRRSTGTGGAGSGSSDDAVTNSLRSRLNQSEESLLNSHSENDRLTAQVRELQEALRANSNGEAELASARESIKRLESTVVHLEARLQSMGITTGLPAQRGPVNPSTQSTGTGQGRASVADSVAVADGAVPLDVEVGLCSLHGCNAPGPYICGGCKKTGYCGAPHQKEHWKIHSKECPGRRGV